MEAREYFYHINAYIPPFPIPLSTSQNGFLKEKRKLHFYSIHKFLYSKRFLRRKNRDRQCIFSSILDAAFRQKFVLGALPLLVSKFCQ